MASRRPGAAVPAMIAHQAAVFRTKAKINAAVESGENRSYTMTLERENVRAVFAFEYFKDRWHLNDITVTKDGEDVDIKNDLSKLVKLLNEHEDGTPGASAVTRRAPAQRNRGVEVRKTAVIRT